VIDVAVRDVMQTEPTVVAPAMLVRSLVELFVDKGLAGVTVVDEQRRVVGMVSETDLILQEVEDDASPPHFFPFWFDSEIFLKSPERWHRQVQKAFAATVADLMERDVKTITPDRSVHEAAHKLVRYNVARLPVVENDRLVGVISRADIVRALGRYEFHTE